MWEAIPGYVGRYEVSSDGRVRSLLSDKELRPSDNQKGYLQCVLYKDNKPKTFKVHRLVALVFIPNEFNLPQVNHKDKNRRNNSIDNLEWCTNQENVIHAFDRIYTFLDPVGNKVTTNSVKSLCNERGLTHANMFKVIKGTRTHHKGWTWPTS